MHCGGLLILFLLRNFQLKYMSTENTPQEKKKLVPGPVTLESYLTERISKILCSIPQHLVIEGMKKRLLNNLPILLDEKLDEPIMIELVENFLFRTIFDGNIMESVKFLLQGMTLKLLLEYVEWEESKQ